MKMDKVSFEKLFSRIDNGFVGNESVAYDYQRKYVRYYLGKKPVLDVACGQGSFLRAASELGIDILGLDLEEDFVNSCTAKGFNARKENVFEFLDQQTNKEVFEGIFNAHLIEHLDSRRAIELLVLFYESLKKGGIVTIITPNFAAQHVHENVFWLSSSHVRPYPLMWLGNAFAQIGFDILDGGLDADVGDTFIVGMKPN
ncbi:hypothetical protein CVD25_08380 [Bacillus canaveralius]|uniref:Class I SAM-dependent methyltransferase n=2 Tax=Bacillus canaveralius TaxID=1403243 RepID=A0A2N5GIC7_9BACI|nr:hypothetical protein CU635_16990 [Bacillus canaveralius]PLR98375.1 hypothetical protein CVD25_08380 [Bacillus canaveralius]